MIRDDDKIKFLKSRFQSLSCKKDPILSMYQLVGEYINNRKYQFSNATNTVPVMSTGDFTMKDLYTNKPALANRRMASALIGLLWKDVRVTLCHELEQYSFSSEVKQYMSKVNKLFKDYLNNPKSRFRTSLSEYFEDIGGFGTSGIQVFSSDTDKEEAPVKFRAMNVKESVIDEDGEGVVDTVFTTKFYTPKMLLQKFGKEVIHPNVLASATHEKSVVDTSVVVLHCLFPYIEGDPICEGFKPPNPDMTFISVYLDYTNDVILRTEWFYSNPIIIARFRKVVDEIYGRGPGLDSISDVVALNAIWESVILATEKNLNRPKGIVADSIASGDDIDMSPGSVTTFTMMGRTNAGMPPIFPLEEMVDVGTAEPYIRALDENIAGFFYLDSLLDLGSEDVSKTAYEVSVRNTTRGQALTDVFSRQYTELFHPILDRFFDLHFRRGSFGVVSGSEEEQYLQLTETESYIIIPEVIAEYIKKKKRWFKISIISPATRLMQAEELQGIITLVDAVAKIAQALSPESTVKLNADKAIDILANLTGVDLDILRSDEEAGKIRQAIQSQQAQQAQVEQYERGANTAFKLAQANAVTSKIGSGAGAPLNAGAI